MRVLCKMEFGSKLYGTDTPLSDTDYKGVFMPEVRDLLLQKAPKHVNHSTGDNLTKNTASDVDDEMYALHYFVENSLKGETFAMDMLHCPDDKLLVTSPEWQFLRANRHRFYSANMTAFVGYASKQAAKYGVKGSRMDALKTALEEVKSCHLSKLAKVADALPYLTEGEYRQLPKNLTDPLHQQFYVVLDKKYCMTMPLMDLEYSLTVAYQQYGARAEAARKNEGVDWKALSHALRACYQLFEVYDTGDLVFPLKEREFLKRVKAGECDFMTEVKPALEELVSGVQLRAKELADSGALPLQPDRKFWDDWLEETYLRHVMESAM